MHQIILQNFNELKHSNSFSGTLWFSSHVIVAANERSVYLMLDRYLLTIARRVPPSRKITRMWYGRKLIISSASLGFSCPASHDDFPRRPRALTQRYRMTPQKSGAEMARIRRPCTRARELRALWSPPASKTLSPFPPQRRLTPFPARDGISLLNRIKTIRELPRPSGVALGASERLLYECAASPRLSLTT